MRKARPLLVDLALAGADVHLQRSRFRAARRSSFLEGGQRPLVLALLHQLHGGLVMLEDGPVAVVE